MAGKIAKKNEKVVINRDFSVIVPEGYTYSTAKSDINGNRKLVFIKTERNALFEKEFPDFDIYSLNAPFAAPQCMTVMEPRGLGAELDLSDSNVRTALRQMAEQLMTMFGGTVATAKESKDILVYYMKFKGKETNTHFMIATAANIYNGQIWINDVATQKERTDLAKQWLTSAENYILTDADKVPVEPFVVPTYNENKRWQMGTLTVAVPDQLAHLGAEDNDFGDNLGGLLEFGRLMDEYAFLAVPKNYEGGFQDCHNAPLSFNCQHAGVVQNPQLAALWVDTESIRVDRKTTFTDMVKNALDGMGREYPVHYKHLADRLDVAYAQSGERDDPIEYWRSYFVAFFHNDTIHQVNVHINAKKDVKVFDKAIEDWISRVKPATEEEIAQYEKQKTIRALGPLAGKNGKIDGAKGTQLFFEDVFFFVKGQLLAKGRHHELKGLQVNAQAIDNYPQVKENLSIFGTALTELINFIEQDELLVLDEECVHHAFDKLNKIDPMIVNGTTVDVKGAKIGKGLSGARIFLLIAWHMIKIVEGEENTYIVALDQNIFKGIPKATAYVLQLIKRLREYNGRTDGFGAVFASTFNMDGGINGAISGRNPLASHASMDAIKVAEGEDPYAPVQKEIAEAKNKGVWDNWKRGRGVSDDDDDDFAPMDLGDFDLGDTDFPFDFPMEELDVDEKGRIAPSDVKTSAKVKKAIKDIGAVVKSITIKGKNFVLTEVMHPDILEKYITQNGGEVRSSTVLATDYIIIGDTGSGDTTKAKRALELNKTRGKNIKAMSENDFWRMVADVQTPSKPNAGQPSNKANSLAEEIVTWFKSDDQLRPLADIQAHFSTHSKAEVKKTLDMLCNEDVIYGGENMIGDMYGLVSLENADDFLCRAPLMTPARTPPPSMKDNAAQKKAEEQVLADKIAAMEKKRKKLENDTKAVRSALSDIQTERQKAERKFSEAKRKIERMTSGYINIYSYDLESRIREVIETANDAGEELSKICVDLVKKLDKKCRPYIDDGIDPQLVKAIADELRELNETAVVDIDFTGSFEGTSFGNVGNIHYEPTREAKNIESDWRSKARLAKSVDIETELLKEFGISKKEHQRHCNYEAAVAKFKKATTSNKMKQAKTAFEALKGYLDAKSYIQKCEKVIPDLIVKEEKEAAEQAERQRKKEEEKRKNAYETAKATMRDNTTSQSLLTAADAFEQLGDYLDARTLCVQCRERASALAEEERKQALYDKAKADATQHQQLLLQRAAASFESLGGWKDAAEQASLVRDRIAQLQEEERQAQILLQKKKRRKKALAVLAIVVAALLLCGVFIYFNVLYPAEKYERAIALMNAGDYVAAIGLLEELDGYQDSDSRIAQMHELDPLLRFRIAKVGDIVTLGKYNHANSVQEIEWYVLQKENNKVLLVSKYMLDAMPFHSKEVDLQWEDSDLYTWMQNTFCANAFSGDEKKYAEVFLPTNPQMKQYYEDFFNGRYYMYYTEPTKYALSKGLKKNVWYDGSEHGYLWWLASNVNGYKSRGSMQYDANVASASESYRVNHVADVTTILGFRPFAWVTLD